MTDAEAERWRIMKEVETVNSESSKKDVEDLRAELKRCLDERRLAQLHLEDAWQCSRYAKRTNNSSFIPTDWGLILDKAFQRDAEAREKFEQVAVTYERETGGTGWSRESFLKMWEDGRDLMRKPLPMTEVTQSLDAFVPKVEP